MSQKLPKYKDQTQAEKEFTDFIQMKWVRTISFFAMFGMGLWMIIDPRKPKHQYIEKVTVSLFKDLWGLPFGLILFSIGVIGLIYYFSIIFKFRNGYAWIGLSNGYYLFENRLRLSGLSGMYNNEDLIVFHPKGNKVLEFKNYTKTPKGKYQKAKPSKDFNNDEIYWSADKDGYVVIYKGEYLNNTSFEWRGDDLVVKSPEKHISILIRNYRNLKDGKMRVASRV